LNQNIKFYYSYYKNNIESCASQCLSNDDCGGFFYAGDGTKAQTVNYGTSAKNCFVAFDTKSNNGTLTNASSLSTLYCKRN
jgi:hypothetical protein